MQINKEPLLIRGNILSSPRIQYGNNDTVVRDRTLVSKKAVIQYLHEPQNRPLRAPQEHGTYSERGSSIRGLSKRGL